LAAQRGFFADAAEEFAEAGLGGRLPAELFVQLPIGGDQGGGAMNDKSDLVSTITFLDEEDDAGEGGHVVLDGAEGMVQLAGDFVGLLALEEQAHGLDAVGLTGTDVLLLTARGDLETAATEGSDIADDGADTAVE
jgi:hypothetical protein